MKCLLVVGGPTASGKTAKAIELAKHFNTEIISFDSRQFYKELRIGTARPSEEELDEVPHHFVAHKSIFDTYTVADYVKDAHNKLEELFQKKEIVVAVGGSGLYIHSLVYGLSKIPDIPDEIRKKWRKIYTEKGLSHIQTELERLDAKAHSCLDIHNPHRVLRALEVKDCTGLSILDFHRMSLEKNNFEPLFFAIQHPREKLYERINRRVDSMISNGLQKEAMKFYPHKDVVALQTVGYREWFEGYEQKLNLETVIENIKRNTRRYAKRQITWFKNKTPCNWVTEESFFVEVDKKVNNLFQNYSK